MKNDDKLAIENHFPIESFARLIASLKRRMFAIKASTQALYFDRPR
jgi:hypothetical protein